MMRMFDLPHTWLDGPVDLPSPSYSKNGALRAAINTLSIPIPQLYINQNSTYAHSRTGFDIVVVDHSPLDTYDRRLVRYGSFRHNGSLVCGVYVIEYADLAFLF